MAHCPICDWRRRLIFDENAEAHACTDAPAGCCDSKCPRVLAGLHDNPGPVWRDIIATNTLQTCDLPVDRFGSSRKWSRIALRIKPENMFLAASCSYKFEGNTCLRNEYVVAFHNTRIQSLTRPSPEFDGNGILVEQRFRFGRCSHNKNVGVNVYADGGLETFEGSVGWVQLEVRCMNTTSLKGGRRHRYCINGPPGQVCEKVVAMALWLPTDEIPSIVRLASS